MSISKDFIIYYKQRGKFCNQLKNYLSCMRIQQYLNCKFYSTEKTICDIFNLKNFKKIENNKNVFIRNT
jgi:hypothetical protein